MRFEGILKSWNDERGFGFLEPLQSNEDVFVHVKAFRTGTERPEVGQALSFEVEVGPQGKKRAKNVELISSARPLRRRPQPAPVRRSRAALVAIPLFLVLYLVLTVLWEPPLFIAIVYLVASLITFVLYAHDKAAARQDARRTRESTLHFLAFIGGWPGALLAQQYLRHKSTKVEFQITFWCTVILNIVFLLLFCLIL